MSAVFVLSCLMPRSTRLFEIIQYLRHADAPVPAREIAEALEVTKRTIYRDMAALQAMRLPIEGEAGIGYVMRPGFDLPPLMFSQEEVEAIVVGLALLGRTGDRGLESAAEKAALKISDVLPEGTRFESPLHVSTWNRVPKTGSDTAELRRFIRQEAKLEIIYLDLNDQLTTRNIHPLAVIYYIDAVILAAWCELRGTFRHFRIDRIQKCRPTGDHFSGKGEQLRDAWQRQGLAP